MLFNIWIFTYNFRSYKGKRILYSIIEYEPLLDSSNMSMPDWVRIATDIQVLTNFWYMVGCPLLIRPPFLQWKSDLIREMASIEGYSLVLLYLNRGIWDLNWREGCPFVGGTLLEGGLLYLDFTSWIHWHCSPLRLQSSPNSLF